jgi:multiple antibiotic resistance protein
MLTFPAVFFIVDPVGVVPLFVSMTAADSPERRTAMTRRACVVASGVLIGFALFGFSILRVFGITLAAFRVAGGLLLLLTAVDMLRAHPPATKTTPEEALEGVGLDDISVVPLAMPLLAGPGAIATVMVLMEQQGAGVSAAVPVIASVLLTIGLTYVLLQRAQAVSRVLGQTGIAVLERVFGLILAAVAVQFVFDGARELVGR